MSTIILSLFYYELSDDLWVLALLRLLEELDYELPFELESSDSLVISFKLLYLFGRSSEWGLNGSPPISWNQKSFIFIPWFAYFSTLN